MSSFKNLSPHFLLLLALQSLSNRCSSHVNLSFLLCFSWALHTPMAHYCSKVQSKSEPMSTGHCSKFSDHCQEVRTSLKPKGLLANWPACQWAVPACGLSWGHLPWHFYTLGGQKCMPGLPLVKFLLLTNTMKRLKATVCLTKHDEVII